MNVLAISPDIVMSFLQGQNIKRKMVQKMDKIEEKIDKLEQIVTEEKKSKIVKPNEDDNIEKFNSIREETQEELNKVKAITDKNLLSQYSLQNNFIKSEPESDDQEDQIDFDNKLFNDKKGKK